jgi:hypothetical protein
MVGVTTFTPQTALANLQSFHSKRVFNAYCWLLTLANFVLVAKNEIITFNDDSGGYTRQALRFWTLDHPPGYPLWLRLTRQTGIPQRLCIQGLYLFGAFLVASGVRRLFGSLAGYLTFALLAFAPLTYFLFDRAMSDGFFLCLTLIAIGLTIRLLLARTDGKVLGLAVCLGGILGTMAITRNEDPLIVLWILLLVCAGAMTWSADLSSFRRWSFWRKPLLTGVAAAVATYSIVFAICLSYYFADGLFARDLQQIPGNVKMLTLLAQIDTGQPQPRFIPISRRSRELAYSVSPLFARLRAGIENPSATFQVASREAKLPPGEIGGGWMIFVVNEQMFTLGTGSLPNLEHQYDLMNAQIEAAFKDGRLKRRFIIHPLIGGDVPDLLRRLPHSIKSVIISSFEASPDYYQDPGFEIEQFNKACLRRSDLVAHPPEVDLQGWATVDAPNHKIIDVIVSADTPDVRLSFMERPDVVKGLTTQKPWKPQVAGFYAVALNASPDQMKITYVLDDGSKTEATHLAPMHVTMLDDKADGLQVMQGIDLVNQKLDIRTGRRYRLEKKLVHLSESVAIRWITAGVLLVSFLLAAILIRMGRATQRCRSFMLFFALSLVMLAARILLYATIDASSWQANQLRYLAPANAMLIVLFAVCASVFGWSEMKFLIPGVRRLSAGKDAAESSMTASH